MKTEQRFKIKEYVNPRTSTLSWRVEGIRRDGRRIRKNYANEKAARCRQVELESEFLAQHVETAVRATNLSESQIRLAETAFLKLDSELELLPAVDFWIAKGRQQAVQTTVRLDDALEQFKTWLDLEAKFRPRTKHNLKLRASVFAGSIGNLVVSAITPEVIGGFLEKRRVSAASKDNDRRALSRFFRWCIERPRHWMATNPCREVHVEQDEKAPPAVLTVDDCGRLLREAELYKGGRLAPFLAVCLFAGLRPFETSRLTWAHVNLADGEIRLESWMTKTKAPRVVSIVPTLRDNGNSHEGPKTLLAWLTRYKDVPFFPPNWRKDFDALKAAAGLKEWPEDVLRHTAISHYFRLTGSYGQTAEQFGNSEAIIKRHYLGRVSSEDTKQFYALGPSKGN